jgi:hypothetical protein
VTDLAQLEAEGLTIRADVATRPVFFASNPDLDRMFAVIVAMAGEIAVLRARLDTHERLAARTGAFDRAQVEAFRADGPAVAERMADRQEIVQRIFAPVVAEIDAAIDDPRIHAELAGRRGAPAQEG